VLAKDIKVGNVIRHTLDDNNYTIHSIEDDTITLRYTFLGNNRTGQLDYNDLLQAVWYMLPIKKPIANIPKTAI